MVLEDLDKELTDLIEYTWRIESEDGNQPTPIEELVERYSPELITAAGNPCNLPESGRFGERGACGGSTLPQRGGRYKNVSPEKRGGKLYGTPEHAAVINAKTGAPGSSKGSAEEMAASRALADRKIADAPVPSVSRVKKALVERKAARAGTSRPGGENRGSSYDRRNQRLNLFDEFGGFSRGYVVDPQSGLKMHWADPRPQVPDENGVLRDNPDHIHNPNGYPRFERSRIFTHAQGGGYQQPNLIAESFSSNRSRGSATIRSLTAAGAITAANSCHDPETGEFCETGDAPLPAGLRYGKRYNQAEMIAAGADGFLSNAILQSIPLSKIDGREPVPAASEGNEYEKGRPITQPIEVVYQPDNDVYMLYGGNHRVRQAEINGQTEIPAFVEREQGAFSISELARYALKRSMVAKFDNPCHAPTTGRFCETEGGFSVDEKTALAKAHPDARPALQRLFRSRAKVEAKLTKQLQTLAAEQGGEMLGLNFKFKDAVGIVSKIERKANEKGISITESAEGISDSLRYTVGLPAAGRRYAEGTNSILKTLQDAGYKIQNVANSWDRGDPYNGLNLEIVDPETNLRVEVQFHTPESFHLKDVINHPHYEFVRNRKGTLLERQARWDQMTYNSDIIQFPQGIDDLPGERKVQQRIAASLVAALDSNYQTLKDLEDAFDNGLITLGDWEDWIDAHTGNGGTADSEED